MDNQPEAPKAKKPRREQTRQYNKPFNKEELIQIEKLAGLGFTLDQIADFMGVSRSGFCLKKSKEPELENAFLKGKANGAAFATAKLFDLIAEKNVTAIIFYLKTQCRWKEPKFIEHTGKDGEPIAFESSKKEEARDLLRNVLEKIVSPNKEL